jgi:hypothetical protein
MGATFTIATLSSCVGATYRIVASTMARSLVGVMKKPFFNLDCAILIRQNRSSLVQQLTKACLLNKSELQLHRFQFTVFV